MGSTSIVEKLEQKFASDVLAAVASLPGGVRESEVNLPSGFLEGVVGQADLARGPRTTYSIGSDGSTTLHFDLMGSTALFQEHLSTLLGENWTGQGSHVAVVLPAVMSEDGMQQQVKDARSTLDRAVGGYNRDFGEASAHAWELATDTYRRLNRFQRAMARLGIPKKAADPVDPANISDP